tara:strand:+ start:415 stop:534 length:120 start_codon:yes stop_codon:yes gene_type:complete
VNTKERVEFAEQRIKELQLLVQQWKENDRKQVRQKGTLS